MNAQMQTRELVYLAHVLNFVDAVLTLHFLTVGVEEINPLLEAMYKISPGLFVIVKFGLILFGVEVLRRHLKNSKRLAALVAVNLLFLGVVTWQLAGVISLHVIGGT